MELGLADRVVIVTGGGSGIGAAVVEALAEQGAIAVILDRREPDPALLDPVRARVPDTTWTRLELTDEGRCRDAVASTLERFGHIDALVNNAGINDGVGLDAGPVEFRASLERNLVHYYTMAHLCTPELKRARGSIVNVSSKVALTGQGGTSGYAAAKGGVEGLTREWAAELAHDEVRVNAVVPGEVMTPMYRSWLDGFDDPDERLRRVVRRIPLGARMTTAGEVAASVVFLLSDWAGHITGQSLVVDGGYSHLDRALTTSSDR